MRRQRWGLIFLATYVLLIAVLLLAPVSYAGIIGWISRWIRSDLGITLFGSGWIEFAANIALFVPMGFLLTLLFRHPWYGAVLSIVVSAGVEIVQIVIPNRVPTLRDIISNSIGAAIGAFLAWLIVLRRERKKRRVAASTV